MEKEFIKKIRNSTILVIISQLIVLISSVVKNLIIPYILENVEMYALWQIYIFYLSYILIFTMGFNDGLYLKYAGKSENCLEKTRVKNSIKLQMIFMTIVTIVLVIVLLLMPSFDKKSIYILIMINLMPLANTDVFLRIFQSKFEMKKYSFFVTIDKIAFIIAILILCFIPQINEYHIIISDILIKLMICVFLTIKNRQYWTGKIIKIKIAFWEWIDSCKAGIFVLISSYLLILTTGIGRILIEGFGNLKDYAMYSFSISISSIIIVLINAVGTVLLPALRNIETKKYNNMIRTLNIFLITIIPLILLSYYILEVFINIFLIQYSMALNYLIFTICMVIVKCFTTLIYTPIMKSLRLEKKSLKNNLTSLVIFAIIFIPLYIITREPILIAIGTLIVSYIELLLDKRTVEKVCKVNKNYFAIIIGIMLLTFIILQYNSLKIICIIVQIVSFIIIILKYHKDIKEIINKILKV